MADYISMTIEKFRKGYNCAQVVLAHFAPDLGMAETQALKVASVFGGGVGRMGETCGAVNAGYMVLGLKFGSAKGQSAREKERLVALANDFRKKIEERLGGVNCKELLGHDISNPETFMMLREKKIFMSTCPEFVAAAVETLNGMIRENKNDE